MRRLRLARMRSLRSAGMRLVFPTDLRSLRTTSTQRLSLPVRLHRPRPRTPRICRSVYVAPYTAAAAASKDDGAGGISVRACVGVADSGVPGDQDADIGWDIPVVPNDPALSMRATGTAASPANQTQATAASHRTTPPTPRYPCAQLASAIDPGDASGGARQVPAVSGWIRTTTEMMWKDVGGRNGGRFTFRPTYTSPRKSPSLLPRASPASASSVFPSSASPPPALWMYARRRRATGGVAFDACVGATDGVAVVDGGPGDPDADAGDPDVFDARALPNDPADPALSMRPTGVDYRRLFP
ncbi:hypothetical protein C8J57DRAFT_1500860 [Mycena rebaudengoi]|nr:hypothetical protein C8J57DRAFT_1500860 [Mycena rebaudengoi]